MKRATQIMVLTLVLTSCSEAAGSQVSVSAASSLQGAFGELEAVYEEEHPDVDIVLNLAASSTLREQILAGAPADVFASADLGNMDTIAGSLELEYEVFATNAMEIAVPLGNPAGVSGVADMSRDELFVGLCSDTVPCGILARQVLESAGVVASIDSSEPNVRSLLTKIEAGELDVGMVYVTDVVSSASVDSIPVPGRWNVTTELPIAVLPDSGADGSSFVDFVLSEQGQAILTAHGFGPP